MFWYENFHPMFKLQLTWRCSHIQVYLYSGSSRGAQRLFFSTSSHGDLRKYICGFFDTTIGYVKWSSCFLILAVNPWFKQNVTRQNLLCRTKTEAKSYLEILQTIGVDKPEEILLVTSDFQAAMTARAVGKITNMFFVTVLQGCITWMAFQEPIVCWNWTCPGLVIILSQV